MNLTSATVPPLPTNRAHDAADPSADATVELLRRLAGMMSGSHTAGLLAEAAGTIAMLQRRAEDAERRYAARSSELARSIALRGIAERDADELAVAVDALKEQLEHVTDEAERSRIRFADEMQRLHALADDSHAKLLALLAERKALQASAGVTGRALTATKTLVAEAQAPQRLG